MERIQPTERSTVGGEKRFTAQPETAMNGIPRPIFRDRNIETEFD